MADNAALYGFRPIRTMSGSSTFPVMEMFAVTAKTWSVNGGIQNQHLRVGDLVRREASGGALLCDGAEGAGGAQPPLGVVVGFGPYWNGSRMQPTNMLPSSVAWGTILDRQSKILVVPVEEVVFEVDCDDAVTNTTEAAYQLTLGLNADHRHAGAAGALPESGAKPRLDISTQNTTNTLIWRIIGISKTRMNRDFTGNFVKLEVIANVFQSPLVNATGI